MLEGLEGHWVCPFAGHPPSPFEARLRLAPQGEGLVLGHPDRPGRLVSPRFEQVEREWDAERLIRKRIEARRTASHSPGVLGLDCGNGLGSIPAMFPRYAAALTAAGSGVQRFQRSTGPLDQAAPDRASLWPPLERPPSDPDPDLPDRSSRPRSIASWSGEDNRVREGGDKFDPARKAKSVRWTDLR